ncbi:MAG: metal-dependent hydrolase [Myxococcales bacterium]
MTTASLGHIAVGMAAGRALTPRGKSSVRAMVALSALSMWPDVDVIGLGHGVPYGAPFGHRGATHSSLVALALGLGIYLYLRLRRRSPAAERTALWATLVALSHGWLDTMTFGGGLGVALLWPLSDHRFWAPLRFIPIAPIGLHLFSPKGVAVLAVELILFSPFWLYATWPRRLRPG